MVAVSDKDKVAPPNSSGLKVIVVGFGYAGVVAAVECYRKGHQVIVYEQTRKVSDGGTPSLKRTDTGDMIGISANSAHIVAKWGNGSVHEELQTVISIMDKLDLYTWKGEHLITQSMPGFSKGTGYMGKRSELLQIMCDHAASLGIEIHRGKRIEEYFETDTEAGIIVDGQRVAADCVLACDGVNSKERGFVTGNVGKPHPTGYATYRAWFSGDLLKDDPLGSWLISGDTDVSVAFIGPDVHCIFGTWKQCKEVVWVCTHVVPPPQFHG
jgi:2-polyprenyl-6-methoxyphenol hydroxylase-like FAD-dependent oxidoreductase